MRDRFEKGWLKAIDSGVITRSQLFKTWKNSEELIEKTMHNRRSVVQNI
jgi:hypothetical protein